MLPLTIGISIDSRQLRQEVENCTRDLPVQIVLDEQDQHALLAGVEKLHPDVCWLISAGFRLRSSRSCGV